MGNLSTAARLLLGALIVLFGSLSFLSAAHAGGNAMKKDSDVDICFIPINANTFVPLTKANITHHSNCYEVSSSGDAAIALIGLLNDAKTVSGGAAKFNNNIVRVMLSEPSSTEPYFIDQNGIVLRGKSTTRLSAWQKAAVQIILDYSYAKAKGGQ